MKKNTKIKKILAFALVIVMGIGVMSTSAQQDTSLMSFAALGKSESERIILEESESEETILGESGSDGSIPPLPHAAILFQFREKGTLAEDNLEIEIHLTGDVGSVKMKSDKTKEQIETLVDDENLSAKHEYQIKEKRLYSHEEEAEPVKIVPNVSLGYSVTITEIANDKVLESDTNVSFGLSEDGEYTFGLYDAESLWVADLLYDTRSGNPGEILITMQNGFHIVKNNLQATVDYVVPVSDRPQKLLITMPPFYSLDGVPAAQSGITYKSSFHDFNPTHYENDPYGDKLIGFTQTVNPYSMRQSVLEVSMENYVSGKISFTFTLVSSYSQKLILSNAMAYFMENPDKVPLLIVADAINADGVMFNTVAFAGDSTLTDDMGNPIENKISFPEKDLLKTPQAFYKTLTPFAQIPQSFYPLLTAPHYPYVDVVRLYPYVEHAPLGVDETLVDVGGQTYVSIPQAANAFQAFMGMFPTNTYTSHLLKLPPVNYIKPNTILPAGPTYIEYTYKGERIRDIEFQLNDFPTGQVHKPTPVIYYKSGGTWNTATNYAYHVQGKKNQQFKIEISNSASSSYITSPTQFALPMVYKDVALTFDIPFEFTLKEIAYTTTAPYVNHPLFGKMKPSKAEYTTFEGGTGTIPVPDDVDTIIIPEGIGHVKSLVFHYDLWAYNIDNTFFTTVDIGTTKEDGSAIPTNQPVYIKTDFSTASGTMIECYETAEEKPVPFSALKRSLLVYLVAEEDGLRFGTYSEWSGNANYKGNTYSSVRASKDTSLTPTPGDTTLFSDGASPWKLAFKSTVNKSKDYEDLKIIIEPNSDSEARALSKMGGMQTNLILGRNMSQYEIFIKTNLVPEGKTVTIAAGAIINIPFNLPANEYVTYLEIRLGTFYGSSFTNSGTYGDWGEKIYPASATVTPTFRDDRYYFAGTDKQELIREGEPQTLVARVETSSEAKYMDPNSPNYFNSTSTATLFFTPYVDVKLGNTKTLWNRWNMGNTFYQGSTFTCYFTPTPQFYLNGATAPTTRYTEMNFPSYDHRIYIEVAHGFEITSVAGYTFVEERKLPATNTSLYVFEGGPETLGDVIRFTGYVRPDAPVSNDIKLLGNFGFDYEPFKDKHLQPDSGDSAYYKSEPYHKVDFQPDPFPSHWGVGGSTDTQIFVDINQGNTINVNRANLDKVTLNASVGGVNQVASAKFYDHQKATLSAQGWLTNILDSTLPTYRATFYLPRIGKKIQGVQINGVDTFFEGAYNLYLSEGITYPSYLENFVVVYFAGDGRVLTPTSPTEWREVESIQVTFDNFAPHENAVVTLPLVTDHDKLGMIVGDLITYVGASSSKINVAGGEFTTELFTEPVTYNFISYLLTTQAGVDSKETGQLDVFSYSIGTVNVYYEENGVEKLLYSSGLGHISIPLNKDATRIEIVPRLSNYMLTKQKMPGVPDTKNSDYPRDTGSLPILLDDLIKRTLRQYDAAFIATPTLSAKDMILREEESVVSSPTITIPTPTSPVDQYAKVFSVADSTIATIAQDGTITGLKPGQTTYSYTVTNLLDDDFVITKKITVLKKAVPTVIFQKTIPDGPISAGDKFKFNIWSKADKSDLTAFELSVASDSTTFSGFFLPGTKYYVEEVAYDSGYTPKELAIAYTTSTGDGAETIPVVGAVATFTVHSDAEKLDLNFVNDSKRYSLNVKKVLLPLNGNHDFTQAFPVTVKDNVTGVIIFDSSLKGDGTGLVLSELIPNRSYTITEVKTGYDLKLIEVVNSAGSSAGITQPVYSSENSFVLTIDSTHEDATILVKNEPHDKGILRIEHVPNLDFGQFINGSKVKLLRSENVSLSIWDSRVVGGNWNLSVGASKMTTMLSNGTEHALPYNALRFSDGTVTNAPLVPGNPVEIKNGATTNGVPLQTEQWLAIEETGITFQSEYANSYVGNYKLTLTWSLVSAP